MLKKASDMLYSIMYIATLLVLIASSFMIIADGLTQKEARVKDHVRSNQPSSEKETLAISDIAPRTTSKPIPTTGVVIHVSDASGNDGNPGTDSNAPKKTVLSALNAAPSGATIAIRGGVYRESLGNVGKRIIFQAYPGEQVWFDGAIPLPANEWVQDGQYWRRDNWITDLRENCYDAGLIGPTSVAHLPDMLFINGSLLAQVKTLEEMGPLRFYVDNVNHRLYTSVNPATYTTEATRYANGLTLMKGTGSFDASGSEVHGIGFRRYGSHQKPGSGCPTPAQLLINGSDRNHPMNIRLKDVTFYYGSGAGVSSFTNTGTTIENASFIENGFNGLQVHNTNNFTITNSLLTKNNRENFLINTLDGGVSAQVAGSKMSTSSNITIADNEFSLNRGTGFWCDLACDGVTFIRNRSTGNLNSGVFFETARNATVASNIIASNTEAGLKIISENIRIYNNTFYKNKQSLAVYEDGREPGEATFPTTSQITIKNNLFVDATGSGNNEYGQPSRMVNIRADHPNDSVKRNPEDMITFMDYNTYVRSGSAPSRLIGWQGLVDGDTNNYPNLSAFKSAQAPYEANSRSADGLAISNLFNNAATEDFHLRPSSLAVNAGKPLSQAEASQLGIPANSYVDAGVLAAVGFGFSPTSPTVTPPPPPPTPPPTQPGTPTEPTTPPIATLPEEQLITIGGNDAGSGDDSGLITVNIPDEVCEASEKIEHEVNGQLVDLGCHASIDTSKLPDGEHELTTRITGKDGTVREITRKIVVSTPSLVQRLGSRRFLVRLLLVIGMLMGGFTALTYALARSGHGQWLWRILEQIALKINSLALSLRFHKS